MKQRLRNIARRIGHLLMMYVLLEVFALPAFYVVNGGWWSPSGIGQERIRVLESSGRAEPNGTISFNAFGRYTLHPYLGFTVDFDVAGKEDALLTKYGFDAEADPIEASKDPNVAIVGITGGSVSELLFRDEGARVRLHGYLQTLPQFAGKKLVMCMLAMGGYSEPQELLSVAYYLYQGGRLDMLIHIDGHNEAEYPMRNVRDLQIYPAYPTFWPIFFASRVDPKAQSLLGEMMMWRHFRFSLAEAFGHVRYSVLAGLLWRPVDRVLAIEAVEAEQAMGRMAEEKTPYFIKGALTIGEPTPDIMADYALRSWTRASRLIYELSVANHFSYFHFLQPSPHFADSKPLHPREVELMKNVGNYGGLIQKAFSLYIAAMPELNAEGIHTYSLTMFSKNHDELLYVDGCCHVGPEGDLLLVDAMWKHILEAQPPQP